nr:acyl-CoA dehydrogenase family protein [Woeseia oceani]
MQDLPVSGTHTGMPFRAAAWQRSGNADNQRSQSMHVNLTDDELAFQEEVRTFFREQYPADIRAKQDNGVQLTREDYVRWQKILHQRGWAAINWPVEYGGTGWTPVQKYLFENEIAMANAPDMVPFGVKMVAPIIYTFGSEEQKKRFLPDTLASNIWWCQGYSEPGSGSDLASLKTRADRAGDHYVINGTKTWTTLGHFADWIFCLVRTNSDVARRQEGISFVLVDMQTPGVTVRPIITIEGEREVNEVHFENVKVPVENLVGEEGKGWTYGKLLLQHERTNIAGVARSKYRLSKLREIMAQSVHGGTPLAENKNFARKLAAVEIDLQALEFTELRTLAAVAVGKAPGPESSILKIKGTEIQQALDTLFMEAAGYYALPNLPQQFTAEYPVDERTGFGSETLSALRYFNNRKASIYGGSNEIQKNIVSKHVLGL